MSHFSFLHNDIAHGVQQLVSQPVARRSATFAGSTLGFTIVELLIVIVVIGILASIVIVAFNGVQTQASNTAKISELKSIHKLFESYKAIKGNYPQDQLSVGYVCISTGYPLAGGTPSCVVTGAGYNATYSIPENSTNAVNLRNDLATIGTVPSPPVKHIVSGVMGPWAYYSSSYIDLTTTIRATSLNDCPSGTEASWPTVQATFDAQADKRLDCRIRLTK